MPSNRFLAFFAALGLSNAAMAVPTHYPLKIENCGETLTFEKAPASAVTVGQAATEVLYSLGLAPKVKGTSVWFTAMSPEFEAANKEVPRLADDDPGFESVVSKRPEFVGVQFLWHIGPQGIVGTRAQFHDLGIPTYVLPSDCVNKDDTVGVAGTRSELFSTSVIYQGVREMAEIFDVSDKGEQVIENLKKSEAAAIARAHAVKGGQPSAVFWISSAEIDLDPWVAGRKGAPAYMMEKLGVRNIIDSDEEWPVVGWETIAKADPTFIVVGRMNRKRFEADNVQKKIEFLRTDPVMRQLSAVKNNRIVVMDAHAMDPTIRTIEGIQVLADAIEQAGAAK